MNRGEAEAEADALALSALLPPKIGRFHLNKSLVLACEYGEHEGVAAAAAAAGLEASSDAAADTKLLGFHFSLRR
jgi:hypothetical protein